MISKAYLGTLESFCVFFKNPPCSLRWTIWFSIDLLKSKTLKIFCHWERTTLNGFQLFDPIIKKPVNKHFRSENNPMFFDSPSIRRSIKIFIELIEPNIINFKLWATFNRSGSRSWSPCSCCFCCSRTSCSCGTSGCSSASGSGGTPRSGSSS